ncbi:MAG TPA: muconolactone Delta-isomerase family protein [Conexibacter sp.]|jgi:muconolactone D-isomerase|nr:muconolactone Delta-isomerase family protein [Conexibacter sp.]
MQFLVEIQITLPPDMDGDGRASLLAAELARGQELVAAGAIVAIWRIPGGLRNVGVWEAADATELHELISSLPLFRWLSADVTALADHPLAAALKLIR